MDRALEKISRRLSRLLRHAPEAYGVHIDENGWATLDAVFEALAIDRATLDELMRASDKARYEVDGGRIRAVHGHSIPVEPMHPARTPPAELFHGTVERFLASVRKEGLRPKGRRDVHLSEDEAQAHEVGSRRGSAVILRIRALEMHRTGFAFRRSTSGVWLTERVPPEYIEFG